MSKAEEWYAALRRSQLLPDAWEEWSAYREQVTDYIIENSRPGTTFAVFGAGRCNDLDLARLCGHFSEITLFDVDEAAMREAAERCMREAAAQEKEFAAEFEHKNEWHRQNATIRIHPVDFVGIPKEDYIAFAALLLEEREKAARSGALQREDGAGTDSGRAETSKEYGRALASGLAELYERSRAYAPDFSHMRFDYTAALGLHSQLGNVPAWMLETAEREWIEKAGMSEIENWQRERQRLFEQIRQESTRLAVQFNTLLLSVTLRKAFIGCELSRVVRGDGVWYEVPDSAVDGAWQAIQDIEQRAAGGTLRFDDYFDVVWPFAQKQGVAYRMAVMEAEPAVCRDCR